MSRGPGASAPVFPLYRLQPLRVGPQDLTRRPAGRRLAPSFLVLQSEKAQPHFGGAFYWAAGPQGRRLLDQCLIDTAFISSNTARRSAGRDPRSQDTPSEATERAVRPSNKNRPRSLALFTKMKLSPPAWLWAVCQATCWGESLTALLFITFNSIQSG